MAGSVMAEYVSSIWPSLLQAVAGDTPLTVRRSIVKMMSTAMVHLGNLFIPMLQSFLEICCYVSVAPLVTFSLSILVYHVVWFSRTSFTQFGVMLMLLGGRTNSGVVSYDGSLHLNLSLICLYATEYCRACKV